MKILFYEIRDFEFEYLSTKIPNNLEVSFYSHSLNSFCYLNDEQKEAQALSVFVSSYLDKNSLEKFNNLKYIFLRSAGYSNVDLAYCRKNNIKVFITPNYGSSTVAEYVFTLILTLSKKILLTTAKLSKGEIDSNELMGIELFNKTIGIIGAGSIGRKVINISHGFNMNVLAYDKEKKGAYNFVLLDELLQKSDFVVITCPLTHETNNLINRHTLSLMKKTSILINVARGEIVNTKDLYMALVNKKISAAALDVIECEETICQNWNKCQNFDNLKNYCFKKYFFIQRLMQLDNVIITPHNAYNTKEANERILNITLNNIRNSLVQNSCFQNQVT